MALFLLPLIALSCVSIGLSPFCRSWPLFHPKSHRSARHLPSAQACIQVAPKNPANFNVDNVRVAKIVGGSIYDSNVVQGMVVKRDAEGSIKKAEKAKVGS